MCTDVRTNSYFYNYGIGCMYRYIDKKVSNTLSIIIKFMICSTQMINIACQNVTEGTDSFDFCEVSFHNQSSRLQTEEHCKPVEKQQSTS